MPSTQDIVTVAGQNMNVTAPTGAERAAGDAAATYFNALVNAGVPNSVAIAAAEQHYGAMGGGSPATVAAPPIAAAPPAGATGPVAGSIAGATGGATGMGTGGGIWDARNGVWVDERGAKIGTQAAAPQIGRTLPGGAAVTGGPGEMNIPYGAAFFQPILSAIMQMLGLGEQRRQFDVTALADARANPFDASQLAARRAGLGLNPFASQPGGFDIEQLAANPTMGGSVSSVGNIGGAQLNVPGTLTGKALANLQGNPTGQGVIDSFARTGGNADILQRSAAALLPALFNGGVGTGLA